MIPCVGDETTLLRAFLTEQRAAVRRLCEGLDAAESATTLSPSTITLGGLLSHLAYVEDYWLSHVLLGRDAAPPWATVDWRADPDFDWHRAADLPPAELLAAYDAAIAASDLVLDGIADLDRLAVRSRHGSTVSLRWILLHLVEEYARHAGHADLIRESIDATTGLHRAE